VWCYTSAPPMHLHGVDRDDFMFYFTLCGTKIKHEDLTLATLKLPELRGGGGIWGSSLGVVATLKGSKTEEMEWDSRQGQQILFVSKTSRPVLGHNHSSIL
jgi:hypothetical protein